MKKRLPPLNANIKRLREALHLSQVELGKRVNEGKDVICHWEKGRYSPTASKLPLVARALGVTVDALLTKRAA